MARQLIEGVVFVCLFGTGLASCGPVSVDVVPPADVVFFGSNIVTMDPNQPTVDAVAVRGEMIAAAGTLDEVMVLRDASTRVVDLGDGALLPGFIDAHGHFLGVGRALEALSLHSPPVGDVNNIDDIVQKIEEWIVEKGIPPGEAVTGRGYDDSLLLEGRHPTAEDLDRASTDHPIVLTHVSGHLSAVNTVALEASDITANTADPAGGHIRRVEGSMQDIDDIQHDQTYRSGFRVAGVKVMREGSPQGRTAWVTEPYEEGPPGAGPDYRAYGTMNTDRYKTWSAALIRRGVPFLAHANGDAAMDLMLDGVDEALSSMEVVPDHRSVIIHAQLMRADQLDRAAVLNVVPSFFSAHAFFWGDWHRRSFGENRGNNISPVRWAIDRGVNFTVHNDAPIVPPDIMRLVSITVNRMTRSGHILGPHQRATIQEALHAVTLGAAYQYFEEDIKGSITVGKQADLVILETNPLTTDPSQLEDIQVLETFSRGRSVHQQ